MNKEEFLKVLETRLRMLEEQERKDMLAEYSQHIDLRMESGKKEEEAIKDFGDIDHLIAEILEAYHIDPSYEEKEREEKTTKKTGDFQKKTETMWQKSKETLSGFLGGKKENGHSAKKIEDEGVEKQSVEERAKGDFRKEPPADGMPAEPIKKWNSKFTKFVERTESSDRGQKNGEGRTPFFWMGYYLRRFLVFCCKAALFCISVPVVVMEIGAICGFGILFVLLLQGYPVLGITIVCVGGLLCMGAYLVLIFLFLWTKKKKPEGTTIENKEKKKEVQG